MRIVKVGTTEILAHGDGVIPSGYVEYTGKVVVDDDNYDLLMVWDSAINNVREMNTSELLALRKKKAKVKLKDVAVLKAKDVYNFITSPDFYLFAEDLYTSIKAGSRNPLSGRLLAFKTVKDTYTAKADEIDALTTVAEVESYDLNAGW